MRGISSDKSADKEDKIFNLLGFSAAEAKIMKVLNTPRSMSNIATLTKVPRSSIPYLMKGLERRSLVASIGKGRKTRRWQSTLENALKILRPETNRNITTHNGVIEIYQIFLDLVSLPKGTRIYAIQPDNSIKHALRKIDVKSWLEIDNQIKHNKYVVEGIVHEMSVDTVVKELGTKHAKQIFDSFIGRLEDYVKIPDEFANVEGEMYIFGGSAYLINWNKEIAIGIHDKDLVSLLLALFSCTKELGTRYSQNKKMELYKNVLEKKSAAANPTLPNKPR